MTPTSDMRRTSMAADSLSVVRSQSDTSYESLASVMVDKRQRRASEWVTRRLSDDKKMILRPLIVNDADGKETASLLHRRLSKVKPLNQPSEPSSGVSRSYSVKSVKKFAEARQRHRGSSIPSEGTHSTGAKVKERTVSNRSLPLPGDETEYLRLRNFSITSKGVVNRGDSFRSKSSSNVPSLSRTEEEENAKNRTISEAPSLAKEEAKSLGGQRKFKVLLIGGQGVGKTSMRKQFMTSDYICAYDYPTEYEMDQVITVVLNNEESQMEFDKETYSDEIAYFYKPDSSMPDAFIIVYSITDRNSFQQAKHFLSEIEGFVDCKAVILVGNKTDLVRLRTVTTDEGRSLAKDKGCKFIETSVAINHQVDELLVGTLTQIRMKLKVADKLRRKRESQGTNRKLSSYGGSKASGVLKRILRRACLKSKSCDNLHVL